MSISDTVDVELSGHHFGGYMSGGELLPPSGAGGGSSKKGGSSSGGFTEDPNTMQSDAVLSAVDVIGEGQIAGLWWGLQSVFVNNVPLYGPNGYRNFLGMVVDFRAGTPDQSYFVGMDTIENPIVVNQRITSGVASSGTGVGAPPNAPFTFTLGQARAPGVVNPDFMGLTIQVNGLTKMDTKSGRLSGNSVSFSVWCHGSDMAEYARIAEATISGKVTAPYQRSYVLIPVGQPPWIIQVRRDSPDFTSTTESGETVVYSYSIIYEQKLSYMNTAAMAFLVDASQFGTSIPTRSYDVLGLIVNVPSNYDPYARTYTGLWDGTFVKKWCNNPAWVIYDLLTNTKHGLGKRIPSSMVDKWALYTIAQYCDDRVPNYKGGTECRFTFDGVITGQQEAYTVINQTASAFRGLPYWGANGITFTQDAPTGVGRSSPVAVFSPANVLNGEFNYEGTAEKARHSIALVTFNDPSYDFRQSIEPYEDPELIARYGPRPIRVVAYGCCRRSQARRYGKWILASEQYETETVSFVCGLDYADIVPGAVIAISDPHKTQASVGGRIVAATINSITTDRLINYNFDDGLRDIMFMNPSNEGVLVRNITSSSVTPDGQHTILHTSSVPTTIDDIPIAGSMFVITLGDYSEVETTGASISLRLFRVVANRELKPHQYQISAVEHVPSKYALIDQDEPLLLAGTVPYSSWGVNPVRNFQAANTIYLVGMEERVDIVLSWQAPASPNPSDILGANDPRISGYRVYQRINNVWELLTTTTSLSHTITDVPRDEYFFAVQPFTPTVNGPYSQLEDDVRDFDFPQPGAVLAFTARISYNDVTFSWQESDSLGVVKYELYRDNVLFGSFYSTTNTMFYTPFEDSVPHSYTIYAATATQLSPPTTLTFGPLVPPDPTGFEIMSLDGNVVNFRWDGAPPSGTFYVIRSGASWDAGTPVVSGIVTATLAFDYGSNPSGVTFWCRTQSTIGLFSERIFSSTGQVDHAEEVYAFANVVAIDGPFVFTQHRLEFPVGVISNVPKLTTKQPFLADASVVSSCAATNKFVHAVADATAVSDLSYTKTTSQLAVHNVAVTSSLARLPNKKLSTSVEVQIRRGTLFNILANAGVVNTLRRRTNKSQKANVATVRRLQTVTPHRANVVVTPTLNQVLL